MNKIKQHSTSKKDRKYGFLYLIKKNMYKGKKQSLLHQQWDTGGTYLHVRIKHGYQELLFDYIFCSRSWPLSKRKIINMERDFIVKIKRYDYFKKMMSLFT